MTTAGFVADQFILSEINNFSIFFRSGDGILGGFINYTYISTISIVGTNPVGTLLKPKTRRLLIAPQDSSIKNISSSCSHIMDKSTYVAMKTISMTAYVRLTTPLELHYE